MSRDQPFGNTCLTTGSWRARGLIGSVVHAGLLLQSIYAKDSDALLAIDYNVLSADGYLAQQTHQRSFPNTIY
jgi:hypothetical protein